MALGYYSIHAVVCALFWKLSGEFKSILKHEMDLWSKINFKYYKKFGQMDHIKQEIPFENNLHKVPKDK